MSAARCCQSRPAWRARRFVRRRMNPDGVFVSSKPVGAEWSRRRFQHKVRRLFASSVTALSMLGFMSGGVALGAATPAVPGSLMGLLRVRAIDRAAVPGVASQAAPTNTGDVSVRIDLRAKTIVAAKTLPGTLVVNNGSGAAINLARCRVAVQVMLTNKRVGLPQTGPHGCRTRTRSRSSWRRGRLECVSRSRLHTTGA